MAFLKTIQIRNDHIFDACKAGDLQTIIDILQANIFIDTMHNSHFLIHVAAQEGHLNIVEYLVNQKADINAKDKDKWTPLHCAAEKGHLSVVEYLVNQKADINAKNNDVEYLYLMILLFIMLLIRVILVLLNI